MATFNGCEKLAYVCGLKIEAAGMKHDYDAALLGLPKPKYVVKFRNPTYDMSVHYNILSLYEWLNEYKQEFDRWNAEISESRQSAWED